MSYLEFLLYLYPLNTIPIPQTANFDFSLYSYPLAMAYLGTARTRGTRLKSDSTTEPKKNGKKFSDDHFAVHEFPHLVSKGSPHYSLKSSGETLAHQVRTQLNNLGPGAKMHN